MKEIGMSEEKFGDIEIKISGKPVGEITTLKLPLKKKIIN